MFNWLADLVTIRGLPPHGYCLLWDPRLIWTHVISDLLIGLAYFSIPLALARFVTLRRDITFGWAISLFAIFILACGTTHFLSILVLWVPAYGVEGLVKALTAAVSVITAVALWPLLPKLVAIPSPAQLQLVNERLIAEAAERERTEELLRQSQKMEAVGQLTGGIAHDFNNLLTVVIGNLDRALRTSPKENGDLEKPIRNALGAAERAAVLTGQLLSFARRQPLQPQVNDVSTIIVANEALIRQTMGQTVVLTFDLAPDLPGVVIDRNQFENALLNLTINARDAMPDGGEMTISTSNDPAGTTGVRVTVTDTGTGMDAATVARAVDPFFTTKPVGKGTGLGLSQVYGFTVQSGGIFDLKSTPGTGTTATMLFPVGAVRASG